MFKSPGKTGIGLAQHAFRIHLVPAGEIDDREQQIAQLTRTLFFIRCLEHFIQLLADLVNDGSDLGPIESNPSSPVLVFLRLGQGWDGFWHAIQQSFFIRLSVLRPFYFF